MKTTYKVKLLTLPTGNADSVGLSATISVRGTLRTAIAPARFSTMRELRQACEKASIPVLVYGMPSPNVVYELTREQLASLRFSLGEEA